MAEANGCDSVLPADPLHGIDDSGFVDGDEWDETLAQINLNLCSEDIPQHDTTSQHTYTFKNIPVHFPYPAYPSQRQMMEKVIEGVTTGENCLLESPTGTGKTAALLCSLLGWQRDCYSRKDNCYSIIKASAEKRGDCTCGLIKDKERTKVVVVKKKNKYYLEATTSENEITPPNSKTSSSVKTPTKTSRSKSCPETPVVEKINYEGTETELAPSPTKRLKKNQIETHIKSVENACSYCVRLFAVDKSRPPRIYYVTRTHSQIAQVVKQLKATAYSDSKMTILASREATCVSEKAMKLVNPDILETQQQETNKKDPKISLNDHCSTLKRNYMIRQRMRERDPVEYDDLEAKNELPEICDYYLPRPQISQAFADFQSRGAWDLEDIKREGTNCKLCPFFGCSALHLQSDIILGSYNYLLQPDIRKGKEVQFINSVLVFDEAHNIEDICRDAFSFDIEVDKFDKTIRRLVDSLIILGQEFTQFEINTKKAFVHPSTLNNLREVSSTFQRWSDKIKEWGNQEVERRGGSGDTINVFNITKSFEGEELKKALLDLDLTAESVSRCLRRSKMEDEDDEIPDDTEMEEFYTDSHGNKRPFKVASKVGEFLRNIKQTLRYLCGEENDGIGGVKDFKGYLIGVANPTRKPLSLQTDDSRRARHNRRSTNEVGPEYFFKFQIICLNPAVGFRLLRNTAYSIIVASGTLTPLDSFASELATKFAVTLQADHVIPARNVWAGVISKGPTNQDLYLNRERQNDTAIQDDLGKIIRDICYTVPNGVLVFFPSYTLMTKLDERWRSYPQGSSIYSQIQKRKMIFFEQSTDKQAFKLNMERYKEYVKGGPTWDGCILFAVFRGKISEGIDFADEQARAVVTIGIPYSNAGAAEIVSKKSYNNMRKKMVKPGETFLSGSEWYTTQAFRAMNQGFGRCVRHCEDWGALILIDARLSSKHHDRYISSWVRKSLKSFQNFSDVKVKLTKFIEDMKTKRKNTNGHIQIAYEENEEDLECTEVIQCSSDWDLNFNSQDDQMLTQAVAMHESRLHDMTTQQVPFTSTPLPDRDIAHVAESSPEYSFTEEVNEILGSQPSQSLLLPVTEENSAVNQHDESDSSLSVLERTPPSVADGEVENDSDREMFDIADRLQTSVSQSSQQQVNRSDILDVSMPSVHESEMSQTSDVSYHSE